DDEESPLDSYSDNKLALVAQPLDGDEDAMLSSPFNMWLIAHTRASIFDSMFSREDANLWECGYVIWDNPELNRETLLQKVEEARKLQPYFQRLQWPADEVRRSQDQRADIWLSDGRGYWPRKGFDFRKVHGLSEESKKKLLDKWALQYRLESDLG